MERERLLLLLVCVVSWPLLVLGAFAPWQMPPAAAAVEQERRYAHLLLRPLVLPVLAAAWLVGWASQEPDATDEWLAAPAIALTIPFGLIVLRACARTGLSVWRARRAAPACTVGLFRPRVVIDPAVEQALDPTELAAVREHEAAHARHRDPLRILVMSFVADLQWPLRPATRGYRRWQHALELARDDEARARGASGEALATGILAVARLMQRPPARAVATLVSVDEGAALRARVDRLLRPLSTPSPRGVARGRLGVASWAALMLSATLAATYLGATYGEAWLRACPGIACAKD